MHLNIERRILILSAISACVYLAVFSYLIFLENRIGDLDGRPNRFFPVHGGDSAGYVIGADNLLTRGIFSLHVGEPYEPDGWRTPGYPFFIAVIQGLTGSYYAVSIAQIFLAVGSGFFIYLIGRDLLHSQVIGLVSAFLFLFDPATIFYSIILISDILFVFLLLAAVYFYFRYSGDGWAGFAAGALVGIAILVRPIGIFLPALILFFYAAMFFRQYGAKKIGILCCIFILGSLLFVIPWSVRNKYYFNTWNLSSVSAITLYDFYLPEFLSLKEGRHVSEIQEELYRQLGETDPYELRLPKYSNHYTAVFFRYFREDPAGYLKYHMIKTIPFFVTSSIKNVADGVEPFDWIVPAFGGRGPNFTSMLLRGETREAVAALVRQWVFTLEHAAWAGLLFLAMTALFLHRERRLTLLLFLSLVFSFAILTGPVSTARYRMPAEPFIFLSAAAATEIIWRRFIKKPPL